MTAISFGTAQLFDTQDGTSQAQMLDEAWRVGIRRYDTAPQYGAGRSEPLLGSFVRDRLGIEVLTTKAGLPPEPLRPSVRRVKGLIRRALPSPVVTLLRNRRVRAESASGDSSGHEMYSGRFGVEAIRTSVEQSLRRLDGRIDRLLMHEIRPLDVTSELLSLLEKLKADGDVGEIGIATQNHDTVAVLEAGGRIFTAVNVAVGVLHDPVPLPDYVTTRVGHGILGPGGSHVGRIIALLRNNEELAQRWDAATEQTEFQGDAGVAKVLLADSPRLPVTELIMATTRLRNIATAYDLINRREPIPRDVRGILADVAAAAH